MSSKQNKDSVKKYEIARTVLARLNEKGDATLRERREIVKRVVEFEDFSTCWPNDQLEAKGLVAEVRRVVNTKDSFTRINLEREAEKKKHIAKQQAELAKTLQKKAMLDAIKKDLYALFNESNSQKRGKALEGVLNRLFDLNGILIRDAFSIKGPQSEGVVEQIDGVIKIEGNIYLVEMKWWNEPLGVGEISHHLARIFNRGQARSIVISASGYTEPAITICKEALNQKVIVLCKLEEIVLLVEQGKNLTAFLKAKIDAAIIDKNPMYEPLNDYT